MQILLVEDNPKMSANLKTVLEHQLYQVEAVLTGQLAVELAEINHYDLVILDLALPDIDGLEVCRQLRQMGNLAPILMLTARIDLESKVMGLDLGADDYLCKPFLIDELLARLRALLRRTSKHKQTCWQLADLQIDLKSKQVKRANQLISLSPIEMKILEFLLINQGVVQPADKIYEAVWGSANDDILFSDTLKVHIARLRKKLVVQGLIQTIAGSGYLIADT